MTAAELWKITTEAREAKRELPSDMKAEMKRAAAAGSSFVNWYGDVDSALKGRLKEKGFSCEASMCFGEQYLTIRWEQ